MGPCLVGIETVISGMVSFSDREASLIGLEPSASDLV